MIKHGVVTDDMRNEWKRKISIIRKAQKEGQEFLYSNELLWLKMWEKLLKHECDLSFRQSSWLRKIYNRIN